MSKQKGKSSLHAQTKGEKSFFSSRIPKLNDAIILTSCQGHIPVSAQLWNPSLLHIHTSRPGKMPELPQQPSKQLHCSRLTSIHYMEDSCLLKNKPYWVFPLFRTFNGSYNTFWIKYKFPEAANKSPPRTQCLIT